MKSNWDWLPWAVGFGVVCLVLGRQKTTYTTDDSNLNYESYKVLEVNESEPQELSVIDNVKKTLNPYIDAK